MTKEAFFKIESEGLNPRTMPLGDLAYILENLNKAVSEIAEANGCEQKNIRISLAEIREGSEECVFVCGPETHQYFTEMAVAIESRDPSLIPEQARTRISNIHARTKKRGWVFGISEYEKNGRDYRVYVTPDDTLFDKPRTMGATSIVARILKVGAEDDNWSVRLRLPDGAKLTAKVKTESLACQLGRLLTKRVELHGKSTWNSENWRLHAFQVESIGDYVEEDSDPLNAMKLLQEATGGFWDTIDVDAHIQDLRGSNGGATA
ncbi:MAG: hypothetical protein GXP26_13335 [Planctomycetes bacterium]|nr:hypothetical protein [Planctomycetota bacterium]